MSEKTQDAEWIAFLIENLVKSGIDEDAHWRVPESYIADFSRDEVIITKPSIEKFKEVDMDLVWKYLKPSLQAALKKVAKDYEKNQLKDLENET